MIVEALSFKIALDLLRYLKKNRIVTTGIKLTFWDRLTHEFITFDDVDKMSAYFDVQYKFIDDCTLGALCSIEVFQGTSNLYDFTTQYTASNITGSYKLTAGSQYDRERNDQRSILTTRQVAFINQAIADYLKFYNEIKRIYVTGIYSPCYALPGWSQGTLHLNKLKLNLLGVANNTGSLPITSTIQPAISINTVNQFDIQKNNRLVKLNQDLLVVSNRISFIEDIVSGNINVNTTTIENIINYLNTNNYDTVNSNYDYLLSMPIFTLNSQTLLTFQQLKATIENEISTLALL